MEDFKKEVERLQKEGNDFQAICLLYGNIEIYVKHILLTYKERENLQGIPNEYYLDLNLSPSIRLLYLLKIITNNTMQKLLEFNKLRGKFIHFSNILKTGRDQIQFKRCSQIGIEAYNMLIDNDREFIYETRVKPKIKNKN